MTDLVIFDCDGVLVDSEPIACRSLEIVLNDFGVPMRYDEVVKHCIGTSKNGVQDFVQENHDATLTPEFWQGHLELILTMFRDELKPIPGVQKVVENIEIPYCVASSGRMARLKPALEITGLFEFFTPHIFNAEMVERPKPAPDLFLYTAAKMDVQPENCLVIEDSEAGVRAAKAAGMYCVGFTGGGHCGVGHGDILHNLGADIIIADMMELTDLI